MDIRQETDILRCHPRLQNIVPRNGAARKAENNEISIRSFRKHHYGWIVVLGAALMLFGGAGSRFSFGVFLRPVTEEFEWSRASMAGALAVAGLATGALRPVAGMLADRYDPKRVVVIGVLIGGIALAGISSVQQLWHLYVLFVIMGIGFTLASPAATAKIVGAWFTRRRALALSIAGTGSAAGETALVPVAALAVVFIGWREGYLILAGILVFFTLPLMLLFLKSRPGPGEHADDPDGPAGLVGPGNSGSYRASTDPNVGMSFGQACRTGLFWRLTLGFFIWGYTMGFVNAHFIAFTSDLGATTLQGAYALATVGIAGLAGGLGFGLMADKYGRRPLLVLAYVIRGLGYAVLLMANGLPMAILGVVIIGSSWTSVISLTGTVASDTYGLRRLGTIYGTMFAVMPFGASASVWLAGQIYDSTGSYDIALWISLGMGLLAATVVAMPGTGIAKKIWPTFSRAG